LFFCRRLLFKSFIPAQMKKVFTLLTGLCLSVIYLNAQTGCNAGYESPVFTNTMNVPPNLAFAIRVTATNAGTLTDLCMWNSGMSFANMKMALYDDNAGAPGNLIASTAVFALTNTAGAMVIPVTSVAIVPGDYYLAGIVDASSSPIPVDNTTTFNIYALPMSFSSPFPATGSSFGTVSGGPVNIWMNITCATSGIQETIGENTLSMEGNPVPAHDIYSMAFHSQKSMPVNISLYNPSGQKISDYEASVTEGESKIDLSLSDLAEGIYMLRISNEEGQILISKKIIRE
jgi:hypothetical protein